MQIKYIKNKDIDKIKWDNCINEAQNGILYGYSWYLDIVSPKWAALILNDYEYIMPLTHSRKLCFKYIYQPFFLQKTGVFSKQNISQNIMNTFLKSIPKKYLIVDISINNKIETNITSFKIKKRTNFELNLNKKYAQLFQCYGKSHKKNIRRIKNRNYKFIQSNDIDIFLQIKKSDLKFGLVKKPNTYIHNIKKISEYVLAHKLGALFFAVSPEKKHLAAILVIISNNRIIKITARTKEGRKKGLGFFIHDKIIEIYSNQDLIFDFIGSDIDGVAYFNSSFGSEKEHYYSIQRKSPIIKLLKPNFQKFVY